MKTFCEILRNISYELISIGYKTWYHYLLNNSYHAKVLKCVTCVINNLLMMKKEVNIIVIFQNL